MDIPWPQTSYTIRSQRITIYHV